MRKKTALLLVTFLLPVSIFLFLKFFGKNEFVVPAMFVNNPPAHEGDCPAVDTPYRVADSIWMQLSAGQSLALIYIGDATTEAKNMLSRAQNELRSLPVVVVSLPPDNRHLWWKRCVFFLREPSDIVLVDSQRLIRGQYTSRNRKEVDRLLTEIDIILNNY